MNKKDRIFVAGHNGLVGSAIVKNLYSRGYDNLVFRTRKELDLLDQSAVATFFESNKIDCVFLAAAKVGGIVANNNYRADFIYENLQVQNNIINSSYQSGVKKLLFLGSTCIYPRDSPQPMHESCLLTGELEYTNEPYAIAKIAGIKMCESYNLQYGTNFISVMPTNLYGINDNFDLETSHVIPALIRKTHLAKLLSEGRFAEVVEDLGGSSIEEEISFLEQFGVFPNRVEIWGSGKPRREFLWSDDMAEACIFVMENVDAEHVSENAREIRNTHINVGSGKDLSIKELAQLIKKVVGYRGELYFNTDKPDGTLKKMSDVTKLNALGWSHKVELEDGIRLMYEWYSSAREN